MTAEPEHSSFCFLKRAERIKLWHLTDSLHALRADHDKAVAKVGTEIKSAYVGVIIPQRNPMESASVYERACAEMVAIAYKKLSRGLTLEWESVMLDCDYLEKLIEKQTEIKKFLEKADSEKPPLGYKILWGIAGRHLDSEKRFLNEMHAALTDFSAIDFHQSFAATFNRLTEVSTKVRTYKEHAREVIENCKKDLLGNSEKNIEISRLTTHLNDEILRNLGSIRNSIAPLTERLHAALSAAENLNQSLKR